MKAFRFSFKNEAKWTMIFSLGLPVIGLLIVLLIKLIGR